MNDARCIGVAKFNQLFGMKRHRDPFPGAPTGPVARCGEAIKKAGQWSLAGPFVIGVGECEVNSPLVVVADQSPT